MKKYLLIFVIIPFLFPAHCMAADEMTEFYSGVEISWDVPEDELVQLAKVKRFDRYAIVRVIKDELQKYPKGFLGQHIEKIYLSRAATVQGSRVGGVAKGGGGKKGIIYITSWNDEKDDLKVRLHHEIAHHIMYISPTAKNALDEWQKLKPENFDYLGSGLAAIQSGQAQVKVGKTLYEKGFITSYASSAMEEDFAEVAGHIFAGDNNFWDLAEDYPLIMKKAELVARVYQGVDPQYTLDYLQFRF